MAVQESTGTIIDLTGMHKYINTSGQKKKKKKKILK